MGKFKLFGYLVILIKLVLEEISVIRWKLKIDNFI